MIVVPFESIGQLRFGQACSEFRHLVENCDVQFNSMNKQCFIMTDNLKLIMEDDILVEVEIFDGVGSAILNGIELFDDDDYKRISEKYGEALDFVGLKIFTNIGMCTSDPSSSIGDEPLSFSFSSRDVFSRFLVEMKLC